MCGNYMLCRKGGQAQGRGKGDPTPGTVNSWPGHRPGPRSQPVEPRPPARPPDRPPELAGSPCGPPGFSSSPPIAALRLRGPRRPRQAVGEPDGDALALACWAGTFGPPQAGPWGLPDAWGPKPGPHPSTHCSPPSLQSDGTVRALSPHGGRPVCWPLLCLGVTWGGQRGTGEPVP